MATKDKATPRAKPPTDQVSEIVAKAMRLRIDVLKADEASREVATTSGAAIREASDVFEAVRDAENDKMLEAEKVVEAAQAILTAFGEEADGVLGVTNALGALLGPVAGGPGGTQQVSL